MLRLQGVVVRYGRNVEALRGIDLDVPNGEIVALLGGNGAGKTTTLRAVSGVLGRHRGRLREGTIEFDGRSLVGRDPARIVHAGVVQVPEGRRIFGRLTVDENLRAGGWGARNTATRAAARRRVHELFPVLADRSHQRAGLLSGGEQQMLAIGRALMAGPRLLLLDEPSLGLAPRMVDRIAEVIQEINRQGTAVLLVEQNTSIALRLASYSYALEVGRVALAASADELARTDEIARLYLGAHTQVADQGSATLQAQRGRRIASWGSR